MENELFRQGIHNAVRVCMNVNESDRVLIISDTKTQAIGQALSKESISAGAQSTLVILENLGQRPMREVPPKLMDFYQDIQPTVTFYAADSLEGEVKMRMAITGKVRDLYNNLGIPLPRHGHMVGISEQLIKEGMTADYHEINRLTMQIYDLVKNAKSIQVKSRKGSDITATFNPNYNWIPCHGLYHQAGDWGNLPEGEVFTCPGTLNGTLIVDVLGDFFSLKYGVLEDPVTIKITDSKVTSVSCENGLIAKEFIQYLDSTENGRRAGEFAIGTNIAVKHLSGNLLQDEKIPGIHVAFGNPIGYQTGAEWHSDIHVDVVPIQCTIMVDGKKLMEDGVFLSEYLE